ncbi:MAG: hypothetical protein O2779_01565 [Nanoarchaeota archaeon]|nr:hypothetical protein [Nanoarchaeota archaeon]
MNLYNSAIGFVKQVEFYRSITRDLCSFAAEEREIREFNRIFQSNYFNVNQAPEEEVQIGPRLVVD